MQYNYEKSIGEKILKLCKEKGRLKYKKIEHPIIDCYSDLDILNKKILISKMHNTLVYTQLGYIKKVIVVNKSTNINSLLLEYDKQRVPDRLLTSHITNNKINNLLSDYASWYKLYTVNKDGKLTEFNLDIVDDFDNGKSKMAVYFRHEIIKFIRNRGYDIPCISFEDSLVYIIHKLKEPFTDKELEYINSHI